MPFNGGMGNPAHTYAARARLKNFLVPFVNRMSRVTPVAVATNHSAEIHLMSNKTNPAHPLPSAVPSRPCPSLVRERRSSCVRCIRRASRCRLLRRLTRTGRPSELTQQEAAIQRHVGPHRPACLPPFLCIRGHSGVAEKAIQGHLMRLGDAPQVPRPSHHARTRSSIAGNF